MVTSAISVLNSLDGEDLAEKEAGIEGGNGSGGRRGNGYQGGSGRICRRTWEGVSSVKRGREEKQC